MDDDLLTAPVFDEASSSEIDSVIDAFNQLRTHLGLADIVGSDILEEMATVHSKYMAYNNKLTSIEESDKIFFRGRYPWDRALYFRYDKDYVYEFVKEDLVNYQAGFDDLINDPISRTFMLDPMYTELGMGSVEGFSTFVLGGNEYSPGTHVKYPYSTQKDVPVTWHGDSFEELYEGIDLDTSEVGLPITITYYGDNFKDFINIKATLLNKTTNQWVDIELLTPGDHYLLDKTLTILPLEPYDYGTDYQVRVTMDRINQSGDISGDIDNIYSFTTEGNGIEPIVSPYITRGEFTEKLVRSFDFEMIEPIEPVFTDVSLTSFMGRYIYTAYDLGLINGFSEDKFRPDLNITREQAYIIFVRAYENSGVDEEGKRFKRTIDVTSTYQLELYQDVRSVSSWAYEYVLKAMELGIVSSTGGYLLPSEYLTENDFEWMLTQYQKNAD